jgi:hypothetical protein
VPMPGDVVRILFRTSKNEQKIKKSMRPHVKINITTKQNCG